MNYLGNRWLFPGWRNCACLALLGMAPVAAGQTTSVTDTPSDPVSVDGQSETRSLEIADSGTIADVFVTLDFHATSGDTGTCVDDDDFSFPGEVGFTLSSPQGTQIILIANDTLSTSETPRTYMGGAAQVDRVEVTLGDDADALVGSTAGGVPESGTFQPAQPLAAFEGEEAAGTWTLGIQDDTVPHPLCYYGGTLSIAFAEDEDPPPPPPPGDPDSGARSIPTTGLVGTVSMALVLLLAGGLALRRRVG